MGVRKFTSKVASTARNEDQRAHLDSCSARPGRSGSEHRAIPSCSSPAARVEGRRPPRRQLRSEGLSRSPPSISPDLGKARSGSEDSCPPGRINAVCCAKIAGRFFHARAMHLDVRNPVGGSARRLRLCRSAESVRPRTRFALPEGMKIAARRSTRSAACGVAVVATLACTACQLFAREERSPDADRPPVEQLVERLGQLTFGSVTGEVGDRLAGARIQLVRLGEGGRGHEDDGQQRGADDAGGNVAASVGQRSPGSAPPSSRRTPGAASCASRSRRCRPRSPTRASHRRTSTAWRRSRWTTTPRSR